MQTKPPFNNPSTIHAGYDWQRRLGRCRDYLEVHYRYVLDTIGKEKCITDDIYEILRHTNAEWTPAVSAVRTRGI